NQRSTIIRSVASTCSDVDAAAIFTHSLHDALAILALAANGSYSFDAANAAYQHLAQGATTNVVANYTVTDEHGATDTSSLTITLTGTSTGPKSRHDTSSGTEDSTNSGSVATNDSHV